MKISIIKGKEVALNLPKFNCDYLLAENVPEPYSHLVNGFKFTCIIGRPQSGKTSMLFSWFSTKEPKILKKCYNNVILVMPRESLSSMSKKSNPFRDLDPSKFYDDVLDIDLIRDKIKYYASEGESTCLILDDQASKLKNPEVSRVLADLCMNRRHYRCGIFLMSQVYNSIPLVLRKLINDIIILYKPSIKECQTLIEELLEYKPEIANEIFKMTFTKPFNFLFIDVPSQTIYSNYNKLVIEE